MASPRLNQNLSDPLQIGQKTAFRLCWQSGANGPSSWGSAAVDCGDHSRTTADRVENHSRTQTAHASGRRPHTGVARRTAITITALTVLAVAQPATAAPGLDTRTWKPTGRYTATLTAYNGGDGCDRAGGGPLTSMGTRVRPGVLAVQQGVFRLGTRVFFPRSLPGRVSRYYRIEDHIGWTPFGRLSLDVAVSCSTLYRWRNPRVTYYTITRR